MLRASSGKHARLSGFVLPAVTPFPADPLDPAICFFLRPLPRHLGHSTSPNIALQILPLLCFTPLNIVRNPSSLVFYATQHRSNSFLSCVLGNPKKASGEKHKKGKKKMDAKKPPQIMIFSNKFVLSLSFVQNGTAQGA